MRIHPLALIVVCLANEASGFVPISSLKSRLTTLSMAGESIPPSPPVVPPSPPIVPPSPQSVPPSSQIVPTSPKPKPPSPKIDQPNPQLDILRQKLKQEIKKANGAANDRARAELLQKIADTERDIANQEAARKRILKETEEVERQRKEAEAKRLNQIQQAELKKKNAEAELQKQMLEAELRKKEAEAELKKQLEQADLRKKEAAAEVEKQLVEAELKRKDAEAALRRQIEQAELRKKEAAAELKKKTVEAELRKSQAEADLRKQVAEAESCKVEGETILRKQEEEAQARKIKLEKEAAQTLAEAEARRKKLELFEAEAETRRKEMEQFEEFVLNAAPIGIGAVSLGAVALGRQALLSRPEKVEDQRRIQTRKASKPAKSTIKNVIQDEGFRSVFNDWCQAYGKEPSESRFKTFTSNFEKARKSGMQLRLDEYADLKPNERKRIEAQKRKREADKTKAKAAIPNGLSRRIRVPETERTKEQARIEPTGARVQAEGQEGNWWDFPNQKVNGQRNIKVDEAARSPPGRNKNEKNVPFWNRNKKNDGQTKTEPKKAAFWNRNQQTASNKAPQQAKPAALATVPIEKVTQDERFRSVYSEWCKVYGKEPNDSRFKIFSSNFEKAKKSGSQLQLDEYADQTFNERRKAEAERRKAEAEAKKAEQMLRDREERMRATRRPVSSGSAAVDTITQEEGFRSVYRDWCEIYDKKPNESRFKNFASNFATARRSGKKMRLDEYADLSVSEQKKIDRAKSKARVTASTKPPVDKFTQDTDLRSVYLEWCKVYDKKPDDSRFRTFSSNFENAKESGMQMRLNEFADCTKKEYTRLMNSKKKEEGKKPWDQYFGRDNGENDEYPSSHPVDDSSSILPSNSPERDWWG